jgi:anti-sigma regulatory factor (Ser/Thr protein kinase)
MKRFFEPGSGPAGGGGGDFAGAWSPSDRTSSALSYKSVEEALDRDAAENARCSSVARIAVYDNLTSSPRIEEVYGESAIEFVERLAARVYTIAQDAGGSVPYTVIREISENTIHADFSEVVVSVLDSGATIVFSDAGPGIADIERAVRPGFSTATAAMKQTIKGVGSGLPIARECMTFAGGAVTIERNISGGTVVTLRKDETRKPVERHPEPVAEAPVAPAPFRVTLSERQKRTLALVMELGEAGPTVIATEFDVGLATAHRDLAALESAGLIRATAAGKREITPAGISYFDSL